MTLLKRLNKLQSNVSPPETTSQPAEFEALRVQANQWVQQGRYAEAESAYREALRLRPNDAKSLLSLGFALKEQSRWVEARVYLHRALTAEGAAPIAHEAHYLMGLAWQEQGHLEDAKRSFAAAFELKADFELACRDLCRVLFLTGNLRAAQQALEQGLANNPNFPDFHFYQGNLHVETGQLEMAAASYSKSLALGANYVDIHTALGSVLHRLGNKEAAIASFQTAQGLDPGVAERQYQSGWSYLHKGDHLNAAANFEVAIAISPDFLPAHSILLCCLSFSPACSQTTYREAAHRYDSSLNRQAKAFKHPPPGLRRLDHRPLRVGFVSGDFKAHPVGFFLEGILREIDRARLHLIAYSNTTNSDQHTARLRRHFAEWHEIRDLSDDQAAQTIHDHQVDILVDLAGHTADNRLPIFGRRPAPIQVSWLGYFASTGIAAMDYILVDPVSVPAQTAEFFSEKLWYLPDTRLCMTPPALPRPLDVSAPPALGNGYITFGSFQARTKISPAVLSVWAKILTAVPDSRLRLQIPQMDLPEAQAEMLRQLKLAGIDQARVDLFAGVHWEEYLAAYRHVDILLDTFPYPGGTTTAEALWMGVPTVTLKGNTMLSRQGASMLSCLGLTDWIADSEEDFIAKASKFANAVPALTQLRSELRGRAIKSPLFDTRRFAANLQDCLERMFQGHRES